jgi:hypothetical protein
MGICSCPSCRPNRGEAPPCHPERSEAVILRRDPELDEGEPRRTRDRRLRYDWGEIQLYHDEGHGFIECSRRFAITHTAWNKAIATGRLRTVPSLFRDRRRRYDWAEVQAYYDEGHSFRECRSEFGFCAAAWNKARLRGEIKPRRLGLPLEQILISRGGSRRNVKLRLLRSGVFENRCDTCGLTDWRGTQLVMHLDHVNGIKDDHRLENLRMLCPNCHSQTDTYGARNKGRWSLQDRPRPV